MAETIFILLDEPLQWHLAGEAAVAETLFILLVRDFSCRLPPAGAGEAANG